MSTGRTLGLALDVPGEFGARIDAARDQLERDASGPDEPTRPRMPAHVTLVPPFDADDDALADIRAHCARAAKAHAPFVIRLRGTDTFRPVSPVVFLCLIEGAEACTALASALATGPLAVPQRFPYHPHVTLAHVDDEGILDRAGEAFTDADASFEVRELVLWELDGITGAWHPIERWPLGPGGQRAA